ncbi:hypothetical protein [Thalassobacillus hwangdonensis]|uniref:Uncharacterized protein n=1 Tax=Thalassobacillus hwangdonensis TaxID=546108 RepID=A0ABW3KZB5_9BACI
MNEDLILKINIWGAIVFVLFLFLDIILIGTETAFNVFALLTAIIGLIVLISAVVGTVLIINEDKWVAISIVAFLSVWVMFSIGYILGFDEPFMNYRSFFITYYIIFVVSAVFMRIAFKKIITVFKILPGVFLFINALITLYIVFMHMWWVLSPGVSEVFNG